jgi:hypothetical protein
MRRAIVNSEISFRLDDPSAAFAVNEDLAEQQPGGIGRTRKIEFARQR